MLRRTHGCGPSIRPTPRPPVHASVPHEMRLPALAVAIAVALVPITSSLPRARAHADARPPGRAPVVTRFAPPGGPPGTRVTLTGVDLGNDVQVAYGRRPLPILGRPAPDALTIVVPPDATERAPFIVTTRAGQTRSGAWFALELPATVASMTPTSGPPGTAITLRGTGFHGDERVRAGADDLQILERQSWGVVVEAPHGPGGALTMISAGQTLALPFRLDVTAALAVESIAPAEGPAGTRVTLRGPGLGAAERVSYGGLPCPIQQRGPTELVVAIPSAAAGADVFVIESLGQRARSADAYRVTSGASAASVGGFTPRSGRPGTEVTLAVHGLGADVEIWFGDARCPVLGREAQRIVFAIPDGAAGRGPFILVDEGGRRSATAELFEVRVGSDGRR